MVRWWCGTNLAKNGIVLLGQVKETGNKRAKRGEGGQNEGRCVGEEMC